MMFFSGSGRTAVIVRICFLAAASTVQAATLHVFAAASLNDSLKEIAAAYERQSGDKVLFNFGASSLLARQIEEGAPADIFFSADEAKMDALAAKGLILNDTRKKLLGNLLVFVVAIDSSLKFSSAEDLRRVRRFAVGETKTVPAGIYAREYLSRKGLWPELAAKAVPMDNVRAALAAVESGNVDAGIVYKTDAAISKKVRVAFGVPANEADISYPVAVLKDTKSPAAARKFVEHLASPGGARVFASFGFIVRR
jgi:molybdate transport system substrate-binding protein